MSTTPKIIVVEESVPAPVYRLYPQRFYILFVFSLLTFTQSMIWITFSPIARSAEVYFNISEATVDLLLNWGAIFFIPCLPLTYILLNKHHGLRKCVILLTITVFIAALLRVIPSVITTPSSPHFSTISMPFIHAGQILNAACGPLVMAPVSQLSCLWFAPNERTRATTVAILTNNFGSAMGFLIGPPIVSSPEYIPYLLYVHLGFAFVVCVLTVLYFPAQPPTAPSAAAELLIAPLVDKESVRSWRIYMKDIWQCLTTPSFLLLCTAGGLMGGVFSAWTSLFDLILKPENYTESQSGWFGFGATIAGIIGGLCLSTLADTPRFQRSLKLLIVISFIGCFLSIIWFQLSVHTFFYNEPILRSTAVTIGLSPALAGLFQGCGLPLIYEAVAEIMFPLPESLSASILVELMNVVAFIFLFVAPNRDKLMNLVVLITVGACIAMSSLARMTYKRRDEEERKKREKEQEQVLNNGRLNPHHNGINKEP